MTTRLKLASLMIALMATTAMAGQRNRTLVLNADDHFVSSRVVINIDRPMKAMRHRGVRGSRFGAAFANDNVAFGMRLNTRGHSRAGKHWRTTGNDARFVKIDTKAVKVIGLKKGSTQIVAGRVGDRKGLIAKRSKGKFAMLLRR